MEKMEKDWVKYPVLHLDLNTEKYDTPESLENKLNGALVEWEKMYGAEHRKNPWRCVLRVLLSVPVSKRGKVW